MSNGAAQSGFEAADGGKGKQQAVETRPPAAEGRPSYQRKYPEPLASYGDVVGNRGLFMETLGKLHAAMSTKFMIPVIGGKELDLHRLFVEVTSRGGIEKVIGDRKWREVTAVFSFPSTATNASFVLRKYYMSLLHHYEQLYFFGSQGWNLPPTAYSTTSAAVAVPSERLTEPISQQYTSTPVTRKRRASVEPSPAGLSTPANKTAVLGVIDGKFESGYFVTVTIGDRKLKGVLFHPSEECLNQATGTPAPVDNSTGRVVRRRRRRRKLSKRDPSHPKPNRSGYNFFFAEQHARLKPLHPGKDREISRMIGELWNNLTETEKAVYQERGVKDKERYRNEMAVYNEKLKAGEIISNAVPLQQRPADPAGATPGLNSKMEIYTAEMPEGDENDSSSGSDDDSSDLDEGGKKSDDVESELEMSSDVVAGMGESAGIAAEPSAEGEGFELRRREIVPMEADAEFNKAAEPSSLDQQ